MPPPNARTIVIQFIISVLFNVYLLFIEWKAAIIGRRCQRPDWPPAYRYLVMLCKVTVLMEMTMFIMRFVGFGGNRFVYDLWAPVETAWIFYIQYLEQEKKWTRHFLASSVAVLALGTIVYYIFGLPVNRFSHAYQLFTLFLQLTGACVGLIDVLWRQGDRSLFSNPMLWAVSGLVFYSAIFIMMYIVQTYVPDDVSQWLRMPFGVVANTFMYGGFIASFVVLSKIKKNHLP